MPVHYLTRYARAMRRVPTLAEQALWELLRNRRIAGAKFRRQQPLGPFIADFYCDAARLLVEADGAHHFPPPASDVRRDEFLRAAGHTVLRFANEEILENPTSVIAAVEAALSQRARVSPSPASGEGDGG